MESGFTFAKRWGDFPPLFSFLSCTLIHKKPPLMGILASNIHRSISLGPHPTLFYLVKMYVVSFLLLLTSNIHPCTFFVKLAVAKRYSSQIILLRLIFHRKRNVLQLAEISFLCCFFFIDFNLKYSSPHVRAWTLCPKRSVFKLKHYFHVPSARRFRLFHIVSLFQ